MACHVSQPTLSAGIAKLEQLLGDRLFLRSNQRVQLTDGGTRFLGHARRIEAEFNFAAQALSSALQQCCREVIAARGVARIGLAGGSTPLAAYADFAGPIFAGFAHPPLTTRENDVAEAVWRAANDESDRLHVPAGADAVALSRSA